MQLEVRPVLVGRSNSLMSEFWSPHSLHGLGAAADARGTRGSRGPEWHARDG